ncbi:MAG TPA: hypothetical protein VMA30_21445 [Xanthobacteraceae bacterium]|nr:hypothetical protein [Xanthobacteraceae bacterium]
MAMIGSPAGRGAFASAGCAGLACPEAASAEEAAITLISAAASITTAAGAHPGNAPARTRKHVARRPMDRAGIDLFFIHSSGGSGIHQTKSKDDCETVAYG